MIIKIQKNEKIVGVIELENDFDIPMELFEGTLRRLDFGAGKYAPDNWLEPDGKGCSKHDMMGSISRHLADWYACDKIDHEVDQPSLWGAQCRIAMMSCRDLMGIKHPDDEEK